MGALALSGALRLWQMMVIVAIYGAAQAFFDPASDAIVPELLPESSSWRSQRAGAVRAPARPAPGRAGAGGRAGRRVRPGRGVPGRWRHLRGLGARPCGRCPRVLGRSAAPAIGATPIGARRAVCRQAAAVAVRARELREGWNYVRRHVWLWGTFASAGIAYLLFMGPRRCCCRSWSSTSSGAAACSSASCWARADSARWRARWR